MKWHDLIPHGIKFIEVLIWPLLLGLVVWRLFPALRTIVTSRAFSVKVAGMEVSVQDATEQLRAHIDDLQKQVILLRSGKPLDHSNSEPIKSAAPPRAPPRSRRVLWVDDNPSNNALQVAQLKDRGIDVVQQQSTDEAMAALTRDTDFDLVISDMGRHESGQYRPQAGLDLLKTIRRAGYDVPFLVYSTGKSAQKNHAEVKSAGGDGATASPVELLEWIERKIDLDHATSGA